MGTAKTAVNFEISILDTKADALAEIRNQIASSTSLTDITDLTTQYQNQFPYETTNTTAVDVKNISDSIAAITADTNAAITECAAFPTNP